MDYKKIAQLANGIMEYEVALKHIQELAETLMKKESDIDVEIMIREAIKYKDDEKSNVGAPMELQQINESIFQLLPTHYNVNHRPTHTSKGLKQNGMPNSVGLIILDKVKDWYVEALELLKKELNDEMKSPQRLMLSFDTSKIKHQFEG